MGLLMTDETGKRIAGALELISASKYAETLTDFKAIQKIVRAGGASDVFAIGDQIIPKWRATNGTEYDFPFDIVKIGEVTLKDGEVKPAIYLQSHYATLNGIQFDHGENEKVTEEKYSADYFYYRQNSGDNWKLLVAGTDYNVGDTITDRNLVHSAIKDSSGYIVTYGYNRWSHSAIRQYLNSNAGAGQWWKAQHLGDVAPDQLASVDGFMKGFSQNFLDVLGKAKVTTMLNTVSEPDKTLGSEDTYDTFWLPALEQIFANPQASGEGSYFPYWKEACGRTTPTPWYKTWEEGGHPITYALENHNSAQSVRLRSAHRGLSYHTWYVYSSGYISYYYALGAPRCAPVCVIC